MSFKTHMDRADHLAKCKSKKWYEHEVDANKAIIELGKKFQFQFNYYHCPFCRLWHVTKKFYSKAKHLELWRQELEWQEQNKKERNGI